jgi:hypothetical protein
MLACTKLITYTLGMQSQGQMQGVIAPVRNNPQDLAGNSDGTTQAVARSGPSRPAALSAAATRVCCLAGKARQWHAADDTLTTTVVIDNSKCLDLLNLLEHDRHVSRGKRCPSNSAVRSSGTQQLQVHKATRRHEIRCQCGSTLLRPAIQQLQ